MDKVKKNNLNRFNLLEAMYNAESSNGIISIDTAEFLESTNMTKKEKDEAILFLIDKGLARDFGNAAFSMAKITTPGKEEYERLVLKPESEGNYLPARINYININTMTNSQIQQGENNVQINDINEKDKTEISSLINVIEKEFDKLQSQLEELARDIVKENIEQVKQSLLDTNKKSLGEKVKQLLNSVKLVTLVSDQVRNNILPLALKLYDYFKDL